MSFSARQIHCLEKMGIVPWIDVRKIPGQATETLLNEPSAAAWPAMDLPLNPSAENPPLVNQTQPTAQSTSQATVMPFELSELADWLSDQLLLPFEHRGSVRSVFGAADSALFVVVQTDAKPDGQMPLSAESAQLFELMLRSIGLSRTDIRLCVVSGQGANSNNRISAEQSLESQELPGQTDRKTADRMSVTDACTPATRSVLFMQSTWLPDAEKLSGAEQHQTRLSTHLGNQSLPLWRMPHPQQLLENSQLKRTAWQVLKAIRATLNTSLA